RSNPNRLWRELGVSLIIQKCVNDIDVTIRWNAFKAFIAIAKECKTHGNDEPARIFPSILYSIQQIIEKGKAEEREEALDNLLNLTDLPPLLQPHLPLIIDLCAKVIHNGEPLSWFAAPELMERLREAVKSYAPNKIPDLVSCALLTTTSSHLDCLDNCGRCALCQDWIKNESIDDCSTISHDLN
ncbi:hypothetical protein PENTCL1PPCAC_2792, partial [Pristionchus entomophagus]